MENRTNILTVAVEPNRTNTTNPLYQFDYGQKLILEGVELPEAYEVHFGNSESGNSTTSIGGSDGVDIPDVYLTTGKDVYAWLYLHTGEDDGETVIRIRIPVRKRAKITNAEPTPVQQDAITQAIAALNAGVNRADAESLESEGYAVGTQNGVPVQEGSPYFENNSKYYAEQAGSGAEAIIDDNAGTGDTRKTWSANKLVGQFNAKAPVDSPVFTGRISMGRKAGSTSGTRSIATGNDAVASGQYSHAEGNSPTASGLASHAEGNLTIASGLAAHAEGGGSVASGYQSHAEGAGTTASMDGAHSEGLDTKALGAGSHAEGAGTIANANYSHSEGASTQANGYYSHAEGQGSKATNNASHSEGNSTNATGLGAHAEGNGTTASATGSHSEGNSTTASAEAAHSEGVGTMASGTNSHAEGASTTASGQNSHAEGASTNAIGHQSHAEGASTNALGSQSHAEGVGGSNHSYYYYAYVSGQRVQRSVEKEKTGALGSSSHSEGNMTTADGYGSHSEGIGTLAHSDYAHAEGYETYAGGTSAHAEGYRTTAATVYSHAEGFQTIAQGNYTHAEGRETIAVNPGAHAEGIGTLALDDASHAEGSATTASGDYSHAEGVGTIASDIGAHAEGSYTQAKRYYSHAEGYETLADGQSSHAEGFNTTAAGEGSHAEGRTTSAAGIYSHAEGYETSADGVNSHAEGHGTVAKGNASHVSGKYNVPDSYDIWPEWVAYTSYAVGDRVKRPKIVDNVVTWVGYVCITANSDASFTQSKWTLADNQLNYAVIVGNGSNDNNRSNAFSLGWDGTGHFAGDVYVGCNPDGTGGTKLGEGGGGDDKADKTDTVLNTTLSRGRRAYYTVGEASFAFGENVTASNVASHAEGISTWATGLYSHAEGAGSEASGSQSHAEGGGTTASAENSHAEGSSTTASGGATHAEGKATIASGYISHSEGYGAKANGFYSHAEGHETIANGESSHVGGAYNIPDSFDSWPEWEPDTEYTVGEKVKRTIESYDETEVKGYVCITANSDPTFDSSKWEIAQRMNYIEIIGNGTGNDFRRNARTLDWDGNEEIAGQMKAASLNIGRYCNATGISSVAHGLATIASGENSHAEGTGTQATGNNSHASGVGTIASGDYSHAEGAGTQATGYNSHAEGSGTIARGNGSHAEGGGTIAAGAYSHVFGTANVEDPEIIYDEWVAGTEYVKGSLAKRTTVEYGETIVRNYLCLVPNNDSEFDETKWRYKQDERKYIEIVGNGTGSENRSNAYALDWFGNGYYAGDVYVNCNSDGSGGVKLEPVVFATDAHTREIFATL